MNTASTSERAKRTALLPFALPDIGEEEIEAVREVLTSGWLTTGERTHELEREFANFVGAKHAVAVDSCTAALHLALESIGLQAGDEVIVPAYTFSAMAEVDHYLGARPVLVDVDARSLNLDIEGVRRRLTPRDEGNHSRALRRSAR